MFIWCRCFVWCRCFTCCRCLYGVGVLYVVGVGSTTFRGAGAAPSPGTASDLYMFTWRVNVIRLKRLYTLFTLFEFVRVCSLVDRGISIIHIGKRLKLCFP